jgi:fatty acid amide hydrolase
MTAEWKELAPLGAAGLARAIASGRVSARDVVLAHVRRIEAVNPQLNAVVFPRFEQALGEAAAADERQARGEPLGPLHGVPISLKDSIDLEGAPSTGGLPSRAGLRADADSPLVARLRRAGAIVVGKTNVPQMLLYLESDNPLYGRTCNPWDTERSPGGSSGGEGALLAAGGSALGLGTDIGGSIRVPAHANGIQGLKPTSHRLSLAGTFDARLSPGMEALIPCPGPLARKVEDLVLALRVMEDPDVGSDATVPPARATPPPTSRLEGLRVGFYTDDGWFPPSAACARAVREAAGVLSARGVVVEEFDPPDVPEAMSVFLGLLSSAGASWMRPFLAGGPVDPRLAEPVRVASLPHGVARAVAALLDAAGQPRRARVLRALGRRSAAAFWSLARRQRSYREGFLSVAGAGRFDAWLSAASPTPALTHGASRHLSTAASATMLWNVLDFPAGVVAVTRVRQEEQTGRPSSRDPIDEAARQVDSGSAGLPVGVQVAARPWREDLVLGLMAALEEDLRGRPDYPVTPRP